MKVFNFFLLLAFFSMSCNSVKKTAVTVSSIAELEKAIATAEDGALIELKNQIYKTEEPLTIENKKNLTIDGKGATFICQSVTSDVIAITDCEKIILKNIVATHIDPEGPLGCTGNVIHIEKSSDILITDSELNGSGIIGVVAYNTDELKIINNHIHKNSQYSILYIGPSVTIEGNTFENNGNNNAILYSFAEKEEYLWPAKESIGSDITKKGLTMKNNTFK